MPERVPTEMAYDSDRLGRWFQARLVANLAPETRLAENADSNLLLAWQCRDISIGEDRPYYAT